MRVNISYSVEFKDVLEELRVLYQREYAKMRLAAAESENSLNQDYTEKNLSEVSMALEDYRSTLASFDIKLAEISNILAGYQSIKLGASTGSNQEIQEEIESYDE